MALSGSFTTSGYEGRCWKFSWTASQNVGANTSTISYTVEAIGGSAGWYMTGPCKVVVAGNIVYNNTGRWKQYKGKLCSGYAKKATAQNTKGGITYDMAMLEHGLSDINNDVCASDSSAQG